jgi:hypothetical protein
LEAGPHQSTAGDHAIVMRGGPAERFMGRRDDFISGAMILSAVKIVLFARRRGRALARA